MKHNTPHTHESELMLPTLDSKSKLAAAADKLAQAVIDGTVDPLEAAVALDSMLKVVKSASEAIHEHVLTHLDRYARLERATVGRVELQRKEAGTRYNFSQCNDPVHARLQASADEANKALKDRETFLKALPAPFTQVDEETGEVSKVYPAAKTSTSTFAIIYPKD